LSVRASDGWLTRLADDTIRWYDRTGGWRTFNAQGQLITISRADGQTLRLHYDSQDQLQRSVRRLWS